MADWHLWLPPALTKRRFRIYAAGHVVSVTGGWIQQVALAWLVFRLTDSILLLGVAGFLLNIFYLLLGPVAGLAADRLPRLPTLIAIDLMLAALALLLAAMGLAGVESVNAYLAVAALIGIVNAFEMPMRQTLLKDIVEERALVTSAIGVSAMVFNVGRMLGPAIAGVLLVYVPEAWCFAINALSYVAIIGALVAMRLPPASTPAATGAKPEGFWADLGTLLAFPAVRYLLPTVAAVGLFATPYVPLMPSIVAHFFDGRASTVGLLMSAAGLGALASAAYLSLQPGYGRQIRLVTVAPLAVGVVLAAFAWSRLFPALAAAAGGVGGSDPGVGERHQRPVAAVGARCLARAGRGSLRHVVRRHRSHRQHPDGQPGRAHRPGGDALAQRRSHRRRRPDRAPAAELRQAA